MDTITSGALSSATLEGIKLLVRLIKKDPTYNFSVAFYAIMLPLLNAVMPYVMVYGLGMAMTDPILTMSWQGVLQYLVRVAVGALISLVTHTAGIKPLQTYARAYKVEQDEKVINDQLAAL